MNLWNGNGLNVPGSDLVITERAWQSHSRPVIQCRIAILPGSPYLFGQRLEETTFLEKYLG